jgi:hypothetical protein
MESTEQTNPDCGCENGECCPPKRKPKWMKIVSVIVLLAALSIIFIKVFNDHPVDKPKQECVPGNSSCCDSASKSASDKPCCSKN